MAPAPLILTGPQARNGIPGTDWPGLGIGRDRFYRWVKAGVIPSILDEDTGERSFSKLHLIDWARRNGTAA